MKYQITKFFALMFLAFASAGTANALPTIWTDSYNPKDFILAAPGSVSFTHDIKDSGYRPGIDSIYGAALFINLYDDGDSRSAEKATFKFDGSGWTPAADVVGSVSWADTFIFDVASLVTDGILNVTVKAASGDFYFADSKLIVVGNQATVPEPMSIAIFGIGLLALGMTMKRRRSLAKNSLI